MLLRRTAHLLADIKGLLVQHLDLLRGARQDQHLHLTKPTKVGQTNLIFYHPFSYLLALQEILPNLHKLILIS